MFLFIFEHDHCIAKSLITLFHNFLRVEVYDNFKSTQDTYNIGKNTSAYVIHMKESQKRVVLLLTYENDFKKYVLPTNLRYYKSILAP